MRLKHKTCIVTGAARGIGLATALKFAEEGANVVVADLTPEGVDAAVALVRARGAQALGFALNVTDREALDHMAAAVKERFDGIDVLVNNAATNPYYGHVLDTDLGAFQKTVDVNIRGYFYASVFAGRMMREAGGGSIINVASVNAVRPGPLQGIYSITKGAVLNMTRSFARECGPHGIRCNAILPGLIRTKFAGALIADEKQLEHYLGTHPLGRVGEPQDLAGAAVFLASPASAYVTGEFLVVDGGFLT
jgi:NAD(P)-dependent dehydrogenase (short-subunit alcohol dehydrogenase family)